LPVGGWRLATGVWLLAARWSPVAAESPRADTPRISIEVAI